MCVPRDSTVYWDFSVQFVKLKGICDHSEQVTVLQQALGTLADLDITSENHVKMFRED